MVMHPLPRSLLLLAYLFMAVSASMSFLVPLQSFALVDWKIYIYIWAGTLTVGGFVGVLGASLRSVGFELAAITLLLTGYVAYDAVLIARVIFLMSGRRFGDLPGTLYAVFSTLAVCLLLARRYTELWRLFRAPRLPDTAT